MRTSVRERVRKEAQLPENDKNNKQIEMNIVQSILKLFFGTKSDKDRKEIQPYVEKVLAIYPKIDALSNDELRGRSEALKANIAEFIRPEEERIAAL